MEWFSNNKNKLLDAAYDGNLKEVKHLLEKKSVPLKSCRDVIGSTPLHFAAFRGHVDVVQYLIERHKMRPSSKNDKGQTPLDLARENNHQGVVAYLTALPAEPAARQRTPSSNHSVASGGGGGGGGNNSVAHTVVANSVTSGNTYRTTVSKPPSVRGCRKQKSVCLFFVRQNTHELSFSTILTISVIFPSQTLFLFLARTENWDWSSSTIATQPKK